MIIKSLARKRPGFRQLVGYIGRDSGAGFTRNLYDAHSPQQIATSFEQNYACLPKRRNGNALYHEVIVLPSQPELPKQRQSEILLALAERYCELRAPDNLAYGRIHLDTDNSHIHLMISANPAQSTTRTRLSRAQFAGIQAKLEREIQRRFPEIFDRPIYNQSRDTPKISAPVREDAMTRNNPKPSRKARIKQQLRKILPRCQSEADLHRLLAAIGLELYKRGKNLGLRDVNSSGRHRLTTLGLDELLRARMRDWQREADQSRNQPEPPEKTVDPRAAELLRQRQAQCERVNRTLRDFNTER